MWRWYYFSQIGNGDLVLELPATQWAHGDAKLLFDCVGGGGMHGREKTLNKHVTKGVRTK